MKELDDAEFLRERLYSNLSPAQRYRQLVLGSSSSWLRLIKYELITFCFGSIPGALGLVLRKAFYPHLFDEIGKGVTFGRHVTLRHPARIKIGNSVMIDDYAVLDGRGSGEEGVTIGDYTIVNRNVAIQSKVGSITIGRRCSIGASTSIIAQGGVVIEDDVQIGGSCKISGGLFRFNSDRTSPPFFDRFTKGPVRIQQRTIIGGHVSVLDGVTIGQGCLIGSGSILTADVANHSIYSPRPGLVIGKTLKPPESGSGAD